MTAFRLQILSVFLCLSGFSFAAENTHPQQKALAAIPSDLRYFNFIWASNEGDLNGDGIPDIALLLTGNKTEKDPMEERLFVLTGNPDGTYKVLSISAEFCHPSKFYQIDIVKDSLFVQMVEYADAAQISSYTLQFRYKAQLGDLELIGREDNSESYNDGSFERTSTNYLTGKVVHTKKDGRKTKTKMEQISKFASPTLLKGYACRG